MDEDFFGRERNLVFNQFINKNKEQMFFCGKKGQVILPQIQENVMKLYGINHVISNAFKIYE